MASGLHQLDSLFRILLPFPLKKLLKQRLALLGAHRVSLWTRRSRRGVGDRLGSLRVRMRYTGSLLFRGGPGDRWMRSILGVGGFWGGLGR